MNSMNPSQCLAVSTEVVRATAFTSRRISQNLGASVWFTPVANMYAVIFLTVGVSLRSVPVLLVFLFWWTVCSLLAIVQHPAIAPHMAKARLAWIQHFPILGHTATYIRCGTVNSLVLLAIASETPSAFFPSGVNSVQEVGHVHHA